MISKTLYPGCFEDEYGSAYDYDPIIENFGNVLVRQDDDDYQGSTRCLIYDGRYAYLEFGWGSCSGCDALQACESYDDVENLIRDLEKNDLRHFDSASAALTFFKIHDWGGDWGGDSSDVKKFVADAISLLEKHIAEGIDP